MLWRFKKLGAFVCIGAVCALGQDSNPRTPDVTELSQELHHTQAELADSKRQIQELRQSLDDLRRQVQSSQASGTLPPNIEEPTAATADQNISFLAGKVNEMHQDKVESASKYPVTLSGLVLFNSYWNNGVVDIQHLPNLALPHFPGAPSPSGGATLRQTMLAVEARGPKLFGARTSADAEIDFAGGNPTTAFGVTAGLLRLRTAKVSLDWDQTSLIFGQDQLFFSPLSPTSYATLLEPAMSWSGNLWVWTPGITLTHKLRLNEDSDLVLQGGLLDPLTEELPVFQGRDPSAGETTRTPAIAGRIAWDRSKKPDFPITVGFGGYRARQSYQTFPEIPSWSINTDILAALGKHVEISGEWYKGQSVGGLGGGIWASVVFPDPVAPHSAVRPLRSTGGWAQLKLIPALRYEINGAFGQDENYGQDLHIFPFPFTSAGFPAMQRNRTELVNFIYKPNSVLLFAIEYRHLFTVIPDSPAQTAEHLNFAAGVRF